jgi:hypothetical protein
MVTLNNSDIGYLDPEWSDYVWDATKKKFVSKEEEEE